jgi:hypothetical protein
MENEKEQEKNFSVCAGLFGVLQSSCHIISGSACPFDPGSGDMDVSLGLSPAGSNSGISAALFSEELCHPEF